MRRSRKGWPRVVLSAALLSASGPALGARAQVSATGWGLSGIDRIQLPVSPAPAVVVSSGAGYGYLESHGAVAGAHHRASGSLAVGVAPTRFFGAALRLDGRHDVHPKDGLGSDSSSVGDPRLLLRGGALVSGRLALGGEVAVWVPGQDAPSMAFSASTLDLRVTCAVPSADPARGFSFAAQLGYRIDRSAAAAPSRDTLRAGDRLSLALSDFDAVLVAAGLVHHDGPLELLGELDLDLLVGGGSPELSQSPLRLVLGARYALTRVLTAVVSGTLSPSARPSQAVTDPFVPVEPRFGLEVGARLGFGPPSQRGAPDVVPDVARTPRAPAREVVAAPAPAASEPAPEPVPAAPVVPVAVGQLRGVVLSFSGRGVPAQLLLQSITQADAAATTLQAAADGSFRIDLAPGRYRVEVSAAGFATQTHEIELADAAVVIWNVDLRKGAKRSQGDEAPP